MDYPALMHQALAQTKTQILSCNEFTEPYSLWLTQQEAEQIAAARLESLRNTGRVEFGEGIISKLILAFRDSPYLHQSEYTQTLCSLQEIFYQLKNDTNERFSDDELLERMRRCFDTFCGSVEKVADLWEVL